MANWSTQSATREYQMGATGELTVVERLASLLQTGQYADVTIRCGSGNGTTTFKAHRLLLATASPPLSKLMDANGDSSTLYMQDVEPQAFQNILKYIYTDNINITGVTEAFSLLNMSKNWSLNKLADRTLKYLEGFLEAYEPSSEQRKNELCDLIILSEGAYEDLNGKCWKTLIENVNKVVPCQGFLNMNQVQVKKMLSHEDFSYNNHLILFEAIRDWGMNQVLMRNLKVNQLQDVIGELMKYVNFHSIKDGDFMNTILPAECLGKADLIAFFMNRGLDIPRDLAVNFQDTETDNRTYEKTQRYKRGYKLPDKEIYKEHELRFRVDKKLRLLGVGFGFLFSNTDMGITVHCQGPWETRQWSDLISTYCRVTWEKMKTADVRLMFSEPVTIEANQSYKILVSVSRMSAGATSVDLWGGTQGTPSIKTENAEFSFLKAAVPPNQEVQDSDQDNSPGMVTDLFYTLWDSDEVIASSTNKPDPLLNNRCSVSREISPPKPLSVHRSQKKPETLPPKKLSTDKVSFLTNSEDIPSPTLSPIPKPFNNVRKLSITENENSSQPSWVRRKLETNLTTSPYKRSAPYSTGSSVTERVLPFMRSRLAQSSSSIAKPAWEIPSRLRKSSTTADTQREKSVKREPAASKYDSPSMLAPTRYGSSLATSRFGASLAGMSRYGSSATDSKSGSGETSSYSSRYGSGASNLSSSKYGTGSTDSTSSRYGSTSNDSVGSRYGSKTSDSTTSRYGSTNSDSKYGSKSTDYSSSRYGSGTIESPTSKYGSINATNSSQSRYGSSSTTSRYGSDSADSTTSKYGGGTLDSIASKYGQGSSSSYTSKYGTGSSDTTGSKYGSSGSTTNNDTTTSRYTSRYGTPSRFSSKADESSSSRPIQNGTDSSYTSKYGSDSSSKYGSSSTIGSKYSSSLSNSRYGSGSTARDSISKTREPTPSRTTSSLGISRIGSTTSRYGSSGTSSSRYGSSYYRR